MKKIFIIILLSSLINCYSQSENETIDYLNKMLSSYTFKINESARMIIKIRESNKRSANLEFETYYDNQLFVTEKFNTRDIDCIKTIKPLGVFCIQIVSFKNLIQEKYPDEKNSNYRNELRILLDTNDEEIYSKIKKALEHLLTIKGAKLIHNN